MSETSILTSRQRVLSKGKMPQNAKVVVYVMSRDQRVHDNHALYIAQQTALERKLPLVVLFNLLPNTGYRAREHYAFMLDGLKEVADALQKKHISFVMTYGDPKKEIPSFCSQYAPAHVYFDFNPLPGVRAMQKELAKKLDCPVTVTDTHNIIPAWVTSDKQEFAAHTIRRKIHKHLEAYLSEPPKLVAHPHHTQITGITFAEARKHLDKVKACGITVGFKPGETAAKQHLTRFIESTLPHYAVGRNDIADDRQSNLSPYLHYGQISSLRVALEVLYAVDERPLLFNAAKMAQASEQASTRDGMNALFEEMIVRKELSDNFCLFTDDVKSLKSVATWAQETLQIHEKDKREHMYTKAQLEQAQTHDAAWNAAQVQLTESGKIHGYMRMYWAKKLLEWTDSPQQAVDIAVYLNDHYHIDGGDPNGYVGILWSIGGLHDRPWTERPVFGKIRYMNETGLRRKFNVDTYIRKWS